MALTKFDKDVSVIAKLGTHPNEENGLTAEELQAKFDEAPEAIKEYINETLLPELDAQQETSDQDSQSMRQELEDIRNGYDGKEYESAGAAVREQVRECRAVASAQIAVLKQTTEQKFSAVDTKLDTLGSSTQKSIDDINEDLADTVRYTAQEKTAEQKRQARVNIGAIDADALPHHVEIYCNVKQKDIRGNATYGELREWLMNNEAVTAFVNLTIEEGVHSVTTATVFCDEDRHVRFDLAELGVVELDSDGVWIYREPSSGGNANIDDTAVGAAAWSSRNIVDKLCPGFSESGAVVSCEPVEGYPLSVVSAIEPTQEGSGNPRPVTSIDVSTRGTALRPGEEYGVVTEGTDLTKDKNYKLTVNAKNASGERVKLENAEVYDKNGTYSYTITGEIGDYDVTFSMDLDPEDTSGRVQADIRLYFAEAVDVNSILQWDEGGDVSLVDGAYVLSEYDPGNVRPITGFDSAQLRRGGKNMFDGYWVSGYIDTSTGADRADSGSIRTGYIPIVPGVTYYFSLHSGRNYYPVTYNADKNFMRYLGLKSTSFSFKAAENERYLRVAQFNEAQIYEETQLEVGSTATPYEPYRGDTFTIDFGQTVGKGTYDWSTGELKITHALIRLTSDMRWAMTGASNPNGIRSFYVNENTENARDSQNYPVRSSHYINNYNWAVSSVTYENAIKILNSRICLTDARFTDLASFKAFLDEENVQLLYTLAEPVTVQLTPQEILALSGENTLTSDTGDTTVSGKADPAALFDKLISAIVAMGGNV